MIAYDVCRTFMVYSETSAAPPTAIERQEWVGLRDAKTAFVAALSEGRVSAEERDARAEKNLLAIGDVTNEEVADLIARCRGSQYSSSPHHFDDEITVHVFKPTKSDETWYIKGYLLENEAVFISVHRTEYR